MTGPRPDFTTTPSAQNGVNLAVADARANDPLERLKAMRASPVDPLEQLRKLRQQRMSSAPAGIDLSPVDESSAAAPSTPPVRGPSVRPDVSSALPRNRPNATGDIHATFANPGKQAANVGGVVLSHALNTAQAVPGAEAAEAGIGSLISGDPYQKALASLRGRIQRDVGPMAGPEKFAGSLALAPLLPANPVMAGAVLGGADQALSADPESLAMRGMKTAGGAAVGAGAGKLIDMGTTGIKALRSARPDVNLIQRQANRAASAKQLFDAALNEGRGHEATQAVQSFIQEPEIAQRIAALQALEPFKHTASDSPEMMDALYKSLSDEAKQIGKGIAATDPSKPNTGRFRLQQVTNLKSRLLGALEKPGLKPPLTLDIAPEVHEVDPTIIPGHETLTGPMMEGTAGRAMGNQSQIAMDANGRAISVSPRDVQGPAGPAFMLRGKADVVKPGVRIETPGMRVQTAPAEPQPPMMPSYRAAVEDFAKQSAGINALGTGVKFSQATATPKRPTWNQITSKSPKTAASLAEWVKTASPDEIQAAREGILGDTRNALSEPSMTFKPFRQAISKNSDALRALSTPGQNMTTLLQQLGLAATNSPFANP